MLRDLITALSLANLCFINTWNELLNSPVRRLNTCLAIILNVILLGALFWTAITLVRRSRNALAARVARLLFPLVVLLPLNGLIQILFPGKKLIAELTILAIAVGVIGLYEILPWYPIIIRSSKAAVTVLSPFVLITISQVVWSSVTVPKTSLVSSLTTSDKPARRVLWLLFDGMDQQVAFAERPASLALPELDRLRNQALYATNTYAPSDSTLVSVPAMLTGRLLSDANLSNQSTLLVTFADAEKPVGWSTQPNVFSRAHEAGFNTAMIGWYVPWCDVLGDSLTSCSWIDTEASTLRESMADQINKLITTIPLLSAVGSSNLARDQWNRKRAVDSYNQTLNAAMTVALDPSFGLMLVHWPVPHPPNIYRRDTDEFEVERESSYLDNLRLVDRALGELRRKMEESGTWENTHIVLTSDHWWRSSIWKSIGPWSSEDARTNKTVTDRRVPFIVKLAGQKDSVTYDAVFNNVLTHDLVLALLRGDLRDPDSVMRWLEEHRSIGETGYLLNLPK